MNINKINLLIFIFVISACFLIVHYFNKQDNCCNIILIVPDSLRADHIGSYGYNRDTMPTIDDLANEGILFEQTIAQSSWTLPNAVSLMTSRYPSTHGVIEHEYKLDKTETLAKILKAYGYKTVAFTGGADVGSVFGLNQGFDEYYEPREWGKFTDTIPLAIEWLENNQDHKFFVFLEGYDTHCPFDPYQPFLGKYKIQPTKIKTGKCDAIYNELNLTQEDVNYLMAIYDSQINSVDKKLEFFFSELKRMGLYENSIIIFTSLHGEEFKERSRIGHGTSLYDEVIRLPLIIRHPHLPKGLIVKSQVQTIDIAPTILDFLRIPISHEFQGKSLLPFIKKTSSANYNKYAFSELGELKSIRTLEWKLIFKHANGFIDPCCLYNIKNDPKELNNLIEIKTIDRELIEQSLKFVKTNELTLHFNMSEDMRKSYIEMGYFK